MCRISLQIRGKVETDGTYKNSIACILNAIRVRSKLGHYSYDYYFYILYDNGFISLLN